MKPAFALSLSFDGIVLLHRAAGGWRRVGEAAPDSPDLSAALAELRELAARLEPDGTSTKLIIPNDQIRYLSIDTGMADSQTRDRRVREALEGATPYPVDDLVYDLSVEGSKTHIAAVARETLAEAEGFAVDHQFNPLCFVAVPGDQAFLGEPFFGPSRHAASMLPKGQQVEADGIAVVVVGEAEIPPVPSGSDVGVTDGHLPDGPVPSAPPVIGFSSRRGKPQPEAASRPVSVPTPVPEEPAKAEPTEPQIPTPAIAAPRAGTEPPTAAELSGTLRATSPVAAARKSTSKARVLAPEMPAKLAAAISQGNSLPDEAERLTVFGARQGAAVGGKPRHLGLILTAVLLLLLAGIAAWASIFLDDPIARLLGRSPPVETVAAPEPVAVPTTQQVATSVMPKEQAIAPVESRPQPRPRPSPPPGNVTFDLPDFAAPNAMDETALAGPIEAEEPVATVKLGPGPGGLSGADATAPEAPRTPRPPAPAVTTTPAPPAARQETLYAATGIWQNAPQEPDTPTLIGLSDLFIGSIDNRDLSRDAIALPGADTLLTDVSLASLAAPVAFDTRFDLDARGLVKPTPQGALSPQGVMVYLGRPAVVPPKTPARGTVDALGNPALERLAGRRPRLRPADLSDQIERSRFGGRTRQELAGLRPKARPFSDRAAPEATPAIDESATARAVAASRRPPLRPTRFASLATTPAPATADHPDRPAQSEQPGRRTTVAPDRGGNRTEVASIAPRTVKPKVPSPSSVTRQATVKNAINLRQVNLIGVYGSPSNRRALVRLPSGRYKKVKVGDTLDSGRIVAIGDSELRYQKGGRNVVLKVPSS